MVLLLRTVLRTRIVFRTIFPSRKYSGNNDFISSIHADVDIPEVNLVEYSWRNFSQFPNHIAAECIQTGRKYTYDQLRKKSENLSGNIKQCFNLEPKDTIALLLPNVPEYPICIYGIIMSGLRMTTINPTYTEAEIKRQLDDAGVKIIITLNEHYHTVAKAIKSLRSNIRVVIIKTCVGESLPENTIDFKELMDRNCESSGFNFTNEDVVFVPYSSGTTGNPKGVLITGRNILSIMCQVQKDDVRFYMDTTESHQDVIPQVLPMFHIYGFAISTLSVLQGGVKLVTIPKFTPEIYLECLSQHRPTILSLVPPLVIFLHSHPAVRDEHFENLRTILSGAAPLGKTDEEKFRKKVGKPIMINQGYGLTETTGLALTTPISRNGICTGTMGHPIPNCILKVVKPEDPFLTHLRPNEVGELIIKGPMVMKGYYNRPEETKSTFVDGWLRTGDMVRYDENHMFYSIDRIKELIKVKGLQVAPTELEELIKSFPGVGDVGVVGIPDDYSGEVPRAYVVVKNDAKVDEKKLEEYVRSKVAPHKKLAGGVVLVDSIPKSASGKILRRQLRMKYTGS